LCLIVSRQQISQGMRNFIYLVHKSATYVSYGIPARQEIGVDEIDHDGKQLRSRKCFKCSLVLNI
jgi:hypothetical protein